MLADYDPRFQFGSIGQEAQTQDYTEDEAAVPEVLEVNYDIPRQVELRLRRLGAVSIRPALHPAA